MTKKARLCSDCRTVTEFKEVSQEYERGGIRVKISGIPAMVCSKCGSISFQPGTANKIVEAANALFEINRERHRGILSASKL